MQKVSPTLRITDHARSKTFYIDSLGFNADWEHRFGKGLPVFMQVSRDGILLYLSQHEGDCKPGGLLNLYVPEGDAWYARLRNTS